MGKRMVLIVAVVLVEGSISAVPAHASASVVDAFHGAFAEAAWQTSSSSFGFTLASREQNGTVHLSVHQFSDATLDGNDEVIAGTEIKGESTSSVSFTIDTVHYSGASAHGIIPVTSCQIVDGAETGCVAAGTATLAVTWQGIGPIPHFPTTELSWQDGCLQVDRSSSVEREANATVSLALNGVGLQTTDVGFAGFGTGNSRLIVACPA